MFSMRYSAGGVTSITPHQSIDHDALQSASTDRTIGDIVTTVRTLLLAVGCDWDYYNTHTAAANWTKRVDSQTFGADSTTQFWHERVANSGTYPSGNFATAGSDQYMAILVALEVTVGSILDQEGFRFRNDDGDEVNASWAASENTNLTAAAGTKRVRVQLDNTGDPAAITPQWEYRHKPSGGAFGPWNRIPLS
jgi:hypothetical protein